ncbi:helix-hairpin-helix domain-containing protein [Saccharophagus sp. K07]|uniref:ComEA family DNA-binding protein n=1 Tax=Saccharophagus sp. K07 TaxID=2283636 RepID=UPI001652A1A7|nr:helix-hairpin-helix domain-containing protein [Saccharophagus sp. K07]
MKSFSRSLSHFFLAFVLASFASVAPAVFAADQSSSVQKEAADIKVNINTASADALAEILNGVGPAKAAAIVAYRDEHGPFTSVDDLIKVKGIGPATLEKNRHLISL